HKDIIDFIRNNNLTGSKNNKVIIVFDGGNASQIQSQERSYRIIFSFEKKADFYIKKELEKIKNKSQVLVVTDDRDIRDFARSPGAKPVKVSEFIDSKRRKKPKEKNGYYQKDISYSLQREITEELRQIWLKDRGKN
ncbi:MAG: NYN domain-containing protein, partial [Candidatus Omnitrophica bacterium]|nr:NYN domain-containing protein [Candidatus Omnitrophota bacterium]